MKKKILSIFLASVALMILLFFNSSVKAASPSYNADTGYVLNGSQKCFFANGTEITISARTDGADGANISWDGGNTNVPSDINVFGGAHADPATYDTKITMNGGTVKNIFGGGLHESYVGTSEVIVNAGTVTGSITAGGANVLANSDNCAPRAENAMGSATRVVNANATINGGTAQTVFGGGEGLSFTKNANTTVNGGSFDYVTAGGSNGYTGNSSMQITNGQIGVAQSVNRGSMESAYMTVTGGRISNFYLGGEEGDSTVTGTINSVNLDISGNATIDNLRIGTSGGNVIGTNGNSVNVLLAIHEGANVRITDPSQFSDGMIFNYVYVIIDGIRYELEKGKTLTDLGADVLSGIKTAEGKVFVKFVVKGTQNEFSETTAINDDIELTSVFTDAKAKDDTPKTGTQDFVIMTFGIVALISLAGIAIAKKI